MSASTAKRREMLDAIAVRGIHLGRNIRNLAELLAENMSDFHGHEFKVCTCHDRGEEFVLIRPLTDSARGSEGQ